MKTAFSGVSGPFSGPLFQAALLFVFTASIHLILLGDAPLAGTEGHRALTAHQMAQGGSWVIPELYGRPYVRKPPLHYWVLAGVERLTGRADEWIWRLPSVLAAGLLAATIGLFSRRWFGPLAGWVGGLGFAGLVALWAQSRTADIDSLNTFAATLGALAVIELALGRTTSRAGWALLAGLALGATLLLKGPQGLSIIAGAGAWAFVWGVRKRVWRIGRLPWLVAAVWLGFALFGAWAFLAYVQAQQRQIPADTSGIEEGLANLYPDSAGRLLRALAVPPTLALFGLPVTAVVALAWLPQVRRGMAPYRRRILTGLVGSVLVAWGLCVASGMVNERYAYVTLPLLCPAAGAVAARLTRFPLASTGPLRLAPAMVALAYCIAAIVLAAPLARNADPLAIATLVAVIAVMALYDRLSRTWRASLLIPLAMLLVAYPFAQDHNRRRAQRSGKAAAAIVREAVPPAAHVVVGAMLRFQPELFYYAGVNARAYREDIPAPHELRGDVWLILNARELKLYRDQVPARLKHLTPFESNKTRCYIVWYEAARPTTDQASPSTAEARLAN